MRLRKAEKSLEGELEFLPEFERNAALVHLGEHGCVSGDAACLSYLAVP